MAISKGKLLAICIVWLILFGCAAVAWRFMGEESAERAKEQQLEQTSGTSQYEHFVDMALDAFSGYAILRSDEFRSELQKQRIKLTWHDDQADYRARLQGLKSGKYDMATFTIDALIKASAELNDVPAVIVSIVDETSGADAIVGNKQTFPNVDALNRPNVQFVLTSDSPSETLARVVITNFQLNQISADPFQRTSGPAETYKQYQNSNAADPKVFVLWEPYVSRILENDNMHILVDSSRFRGYIVDVLVVNRDFLAKNQSLVESILGSYYKTAYDYRDKMVSLVMADSAKTGDKLSQSQAETLVRGIRWKNTQENFAHFGIHQSESLQHVEDMIYNITSVLKKTKAIQTDPLDGRANRLYFDNALKTLRDSDFHPGLSAEQITSDQIQLPKLNDSEWNSLQEVGELNVPQLVFARGTATLTDSSSFVLDELVRTLRNWPRYYLMVKGNASTRGNAAANAKLAEARAQAAADYLIAKGVDKNRIRAEGGKPSGQTTVTFVLGEAPY